MEGGGVFINNASKINVSNVNGPFLILTYLLPCMVLFELTDQGSVF